MDLGINATADRAEWRTRSRLPHFRDYHLPFDKRATEILAMTDVIAERLRKKAAARRDRSVRSHLVTACWTTARLT